MSGSPYDGTAMAPEEPHYISREELLDELVRYTTAFRIHFVVTTATINPIISTRLPTNVSRQAFQKLMMQSLEPTSEDYEETKGEIDKSTASLRTRLAALKQKKKPAVNVVLKGPFLAAKSSSHKNKPSNPQDSSPSSFQRQAVVPPTLGAASSGHPSLNNLYTYNSVDPFSGTLLLSTSSLALCSHLWSAYSTIVWELIRLAISPTTSQPTSD